MSVISVDMALSLGTKLCFNWSKRLNQFHLRLISTTAINRDSNSTTIKLINGRNLTFTTGKFAKMADGSCVCQCGDTAVMVTAVSKAGSESPSFLPLTVDFRMKSAAAGRIPTNFLRRELGPSESEILAGRMIDRSVRPLFPPDFFSQVQIMANLLAVDGVHDPEILCINAASMALAVSDIPWDGPIGAVRVGLVDGEVIINPTRQELKQSTLNLVVTGKASSHIVMMEGSCDNISINDLLRAISKGLNQTQVIVSVMQQVVDNQKNQKQKQVMKQAEQKNLVTDEGKDSLIELVRPLCEQEITEIFQDFSLHKITRDEALNVVRSKVLETIQTNHEPKFSSADINSVINTIIKQVFRDLIFSTDLRCDGRTLTDIRDITCEVDLYKPLHGSALFQRGQTQVLCTVALDSPQSAIKTDSYTTLTSGIKEKNFFLHYEFPPYATNEIGIQRGANRREIGHGALAEKGLKPVVPKDFPFSIRLTSEVLESNGSSSMATVCGGSMALLDAGVPISAPVAGVAMGLVTRLDDKKKILDYRILTDILGIEDYMGDMDFKIAGTSTGITALQVDFKIPGVTMAVIMQALTEAHLAHKKILHTMHGVISAPRKKDENMPIIETFEVPAHKRGKLAGMGSINFKKVFLQTGVQITPIEDAKYCAFAPNETAMDEAYEMVRQLMEVENEPVFEFGAIYSVRIVELRESGIMVSLHPKMMPIFIHNSQLDTRKVGHASALGFEVGQKVSVKYFGRDPATGHIRLSKRVLHGSSDNVRDFDKDGPMSTTAPTTIIRERIREVEEDKDYNQEIGDKS